MFCHLAGLAGFVIPVVLSGIIAPLIVWQMKKGESTLIDEHGREAVNFQLSYTLYIFVSAILCIFLIGIPLLVVAIVAQLVFMIIAAIRANSGETYRIPFIFRLV